jgi:hypothetical protein
MRIEAVRDGIWRAFAAEERSITPARLSLASLAIMVRSSVFMEYYVVLYMHNI